MKKISILLINLFVAANSFAATPLTTTSKATATLATSCSLTMSNVAFGEVIPGSASATASSNLNITCSNGLAYTFYGTYPSDGSDCPYMVGQTKSNKLHYWIKYQNVFLTNLSNGKVSSTGSGIVQNYPIQGIIQPTGIPANYGCSGADPTANYGFNPYVAPDNYSSSGTLNLVF